MWPRPLPGHSCCRLQIGSLLNTHMTSKPCGAGRKSVRCLIATLLGQTSLQSNGAMGRFKLYIIECTNDNVGQSFLFVFVHLTTPLFFPNRNKILTKVKFRPLRSGELHKIYHKAILDQQVGI